MTGIEAIEKNSAGVSRGENLIGMMMPGVADAPLPTKLEKVFLDFNSPKQFYDAADTFITNKIVLGDGSPDENKAKKAQYREVALKVAEALTPMFNTLAEQNKPKGPGFTRS